MSRSAARWLACLVVLASAGCASIQKGKARSDRLETELNGYRYKQPREQVWHEVKQLLSDRDYPLGEADARAVGQRQGGLGAALGVGPEKSTYRYGERTGLAAKLFGTSSAGAEDGSVSLDTGWKKKERYHVDGLVVEDGFRVVFARIQVSFGADFSGYEETTTRDIELELALVQRVDPEAADRIEKAVDAAVK